MCGIAGYWQPGGWRHRDGEAIAQRMADTMRPRGPDDAGTWGDAPAGVALGFRRLSIVDTSPLGHQPMASSSGRLVMVFNGEVYNATELRPELERSGVRFRGHSDSEVLLAAIEVWGMDATLERVRGMFALAVWDAAARALWLARDPFGEKPLYHGWTRDGTTLLFASEPKALRAHPDFVPTVDRAALTRYARYGYIPAPLSVWEGIGKLPPGSVVRITASERTPEPRRYFILEQLAERGRRAPLPLDVEGCASRLATELERTVREQVVADVPVGAFLSGGIDSSLVVALMQAQSSRPVRTFCIGFDSPRHDESSFAARVASRLGTDHTMLRVTGADALGVVPDLPAIYCEPFADSSQIPTVLVARLARSRVTVALTGDGGDELFGGYHRYGMMQRLAPLLHLPGRRIAARAARRALLLAERLPGGARHLATALARRADVAAVADADALYAAYMSLWYEPERAIVGGHEPRGILPLSREVLAGGHVVERAMLADQRLYLPEDLLVKVDRAAMSTSLESRMPFLDREVAALSWQLPFATKVQGAVGKVVLRALLGRHLPADWFARPKLGFMVPMAPWLRGPLRPWAESLLDPRALREEGMLDVAVVRRAWGAFLDGSREWHGFLWSMLMWRAWSVAQSAPRP